MHIYAYMCVYLSICQISISRSLSFCFSRSFSLSRCLSLCLSLSVSVALVWFFSFSRKLSRCLSIPLSISLSCFLSLFQSLCLPLSLISLSLFHFLFLSCFFSFWLSLVPSPFLWCSLFISPSLSRPVFLAYSLSPSLVLSVSGKFISLSQFLSPSRCLSLSLACSCSLSFFLFLSLSLSHTVSICLFLVLSPSCSRARALSLCFHFFSFSPFLPLSLSSLFVNPTLTLQHSLLQIVTTTHCNTSQRTATPFTSTLSPKRSSKAPRLKTYSDTLRHSETSCCQTVSHCKTPKHTATHCMPLQHTATHCNTLQRTATHRNTLQQLHHCNTLQHIASHCNTLQHTHSNTQIEGVAADVRELTTLSLSSNLNSSLRALAAETAIRALGVTLHTIRAPSQTLLYVHLQHTAAHCNTLHHAATQCNTLFHITPRCTTLHHSAPHSRYVTYWPHLFSMSLDWTSHFPCISMSCPFHQQVMSLVSTTHVPYMNESSPLYERVRSLVSKYRDTISTLSVILIFDWCCLWYVIRSSLEVLVEALFTQWMLSFILPHCNTLRITFLFFRTCRVSSFCSS